LTTYSIKSNGRGIIVLAAARFEIDNSGNNPFILFRDRSDNVTACVYLYGREDLDIIANTPGGEVAIVKGGAVAEGGN
jgi:hypothetical protein